MSRKKAIFDQSKLDIVYIIINIFLAIILVPFYLKFISIDLYGFWLATSGVLILLEVFDLGINTLFIDKLSRFYSNKEHSNLLNHFYSGLFLFFLISLFIFLVGIFLSFFLNTYFKLGEFEYIIIKCFRIALFTTSLKIINSALINFGSSVLQPLKYSLVKIISTIISLFLVVILLKNNFGLLSLAYGYLIQQIISLISNAVISLFVVSNITNKFFGKIQKVIIADYIKNSKYLFTSKASDIAVKSIEPIFIASSLGPKVSSIYILSKKASDIIYQIINVFTNSSFPSLISINENNSLEAKYKLDLFSNSIYFLSTICFSFYIILNNYFLFFWVGEEFLISEISVILFGTSSFLMVLMQYKIILEYSKNNIQRTSRILIFESILRTLLFYLFIKIFGFNGGPLSVIISVLSFLFLVNKRLVIYKHIIPTLMIFLSSYLIIILNLGLSLFLSIILKVIFHLLVIILIFKIFKIFKKDIIRAFNYSTNNVFEKK